MLRNDGKCGSDYWLPNGTATAQCDPDGENPCCSDWRNGECGNTTKHCSCRSCKDYKFAKWWRESGGTQMWRNDGKCGRYYPLPDGTAAQCDPDGENPCCALRKGECGNTTEHCSCRYCTNYTRLYRDWRESGGTQMWRYDGKCGRYYLLPNGTAAQCDPDGENPCCRQNFFGFGVCGNTTEHCSCRYCTNYTRLYRDWRESGGTQMWRNDGKCGSDYWLPNGTAAQCDPDGENPCCEGFYGDCGNTTGHCSCPYCKDYKFEKWWRESGGTQMWRNDGKCGRYYLLPDGTAAECNPDGKKPCCNRNGVCEYHYLFQDCYCSGCVDYKEVKKLRELGESCAIIKTRAGFLKTACFNEKTKVLNYKCAHSDVYYSLDYEYDDDYDDGLIDEHFKGFSVTEVCKNDKHGYQACGLVLSRTNSDVLCGGYFCKHREYDEKHKLIRCSGDDCKAENRSCIESRYNTDILCDDKCDMWSCKDESFCNGYQYGINCRVEKEVHRMLKVHYVPVHFLCLVSIMNENTSFCEDESDTRNCANNTVRETCIHYIGKVVFNKSVDVPISNYTRCSVFDNDSLPYCLNYMDQTNCSDLERVGGYCEVNGYMSTVSKYMLCREHDPIANQSIHLCDDDSQINCMNITSPSSSCRVHKHLMCDGVKDCPDGADEIHDMCKTMTAGFHIVCKRRFNPRNNETRIPISWIMDEALDCMNHEDENSSLWNFCPGEVEQMLLTGQNCKTFINVPMTRKLMFRLISYVMVLSRVVTVLKTMSVK